MIHIDGSYPPFETMTCASSAQCIAGRGVEDTASRLINVGTL